MDEFVTFEGYLEDQSIELASLSSEELREWQDIFEESRKRYATTPKLGLMKLRSLPGEHLYAVAVREGSELWLAFWVRRSRKGEVFTMVPRSDRGWNPHTSYHLDGTLHTKSCDQAVLSTKCQRLTAAFRGTEHLGMSMGYSPSSVGAICDPTAFAGVVEVEAGVLGPRRGWIAVDLMEPGREPSALGSWARIAKQEVFRDAVPWLVVRVGFSELP